MAAIAERLGTTEFWIAKVAAEMAERRLLVLGDDSAEPVSEPDLPVAFGEPAAPADSWWVEPREDTPPRSSRSRRPDGLPGDCIGRLRAGPSRSPFDPPTDESKESRFGHFVKVEQDGRALRSERGDVRPIL